MLLSSANLTTPAVAYLAGAGGFDAGIVISASHNPYRDNGIKIIDHSGFKLPDEQEDVLEYWKSAPYLLNFMEDYELKRQLHEKLENLSQSFLDSVINFTRIYPEKYSFFCILSG